MRLILNILLFCCILLRVSAQESSVWLHPNKGQWHPNVLYQVDLSAGKMYVEPTGFTYHFIENPRKDHHAAEVTSNSIEVESLQQHVVRSKFIGSSWQENKIENRTSNFYRNYYIGTDKAQWASNVHSYEQVILKDLYPGVNLQLDGEKAQLKYAFIVAPQTSANQIRWNIEGADGIQLERDGSITIKTTLGEINESKPIAWTVRNGVKTPVEINYRLKNQTIQFDLPNGYNNLDTLIIDPYLVFSTYTGATSDNWGMTATPGPNGEMLAGGIVFGAGYPISSGAYDGSFNGGTANFNLSGFDVAISKFSADGSQLLFSTFLGGAANELPESMITNTHGDLFVMGITASNNFPVGTNAYQPAFAGGPSATHNSLRFDGSDLFITRFNANGTQLLGSTYLGGSNLDGLNISNLSFNYGDQYRGEILLQDTTVLIASHSRSSNFPTTNGTLMTGLQDGVAVKLTEDLSSIIWSTFFGGSGEETGNSIALSSDGKLYITGGTSSNNFHFSGLDTSFDGDRDGYILQLNSQSGAIVRGTYLGYNSYDQCYFVRTDLDNKVYVYGQTKTDWTISPGRYGNPNSGQFINKYNADLSVLEWSTTIGAGIGEPEISPTAFLISDCFDIFLAGWGGNVNVSGQAQYSTSNGFPVTPDAYQSTSNGSNFYLAILSQDASDLIYGTFIGGFSSSSNHVDGGTSRFDRSGAVYHAVCASCQGNSNGFMSTPGSWSTVNNSPNCNLAAFKFQLGMPYSLSPNTTICEGTTTQLNATGGTAYNWSPANSLNNANIANPIASPTETTVYYVSMDFNEGCAIVDSIIVEVIQPPTIDLASTVTICKNEATAITASGGSNYSWSPTTFITSSSSATVTVNPPQSMYYYVTVSNECFDRLDSIWVEVLPLPEIILTNDTLICRGDAALLVPEGNMQASWQPHSTLQEQANGNAIVTPINERYYFVTGVDEHGCENKDSVFVSFYPIPPIEISPDTAICLGTSTQLNVSGGTAYLWSPATYLNAANIANPIATPSENINYTVDITYGLNCIEQRSVAIDLMYLPVPQVPDTVLACYQEAKTITVGGADTYSWSPPTYLNTTQGPIVEAMILEDITYIVTFSNVCGSVYDTVPVVAISPFVEAFGDTIICPRQSTQLYATGSLHYDWSPSQSLSSSITSMVVATPTAPTTYYVMGTDQYGCKKTDSVFVDLFPQPYIIASPDQYLFEGDSANISGTTSSSGVIFWTPTEYLSCVMCANTTATPPGNMQYIVTIIDENGCSDADDVWILFEPLIYVPNTFTPQGDGMNEVFKVIGGNVTDFDWMIFDRWGELIYKSTDLREGWDGTYKGKICQDGTYTWKLKYNDLQGKEYKHVGHVNLLR